ncbi:hypothetical protein ES705_32354 [subsurface metagenome]
MQRPISDVQIAGKSPPVGSASRIILAALPERHLCFSVHARQPKYPIEEERVDSWEAPCTDRPVSLISVRVNRPGRAAIAAQANKNQPGQQFCEGNVLAHLPFEILPHLPSARMHGASRKAERPERADYLTTFFRKEYKANSNAY